MVKSGRIGVRVDPKDKKRWEELATDAGISLSAWIEYWLELGTNIQEKLTQK